MVVAALLTAQVVVAAAAFALPPFAAEYRPGSELQASLDAAIAAGAASFEIPANSYAFTNASARFGGAALLVAGASNMRIHGAGVASTSMWFVPGYGIDVVGCVNVTLEGFATDTLTPAFSQGELVALDLAARTATLRVEGGFPLPTDPSLFNQTCPDGSGGFCGEVKAVFWDAATRRMRAGQQMNQPVHAVSCNGSLCTVSLPTLWQDEWAVPPAGGGRTLLTLSPRIWASKWAVPTYYKGTFGVFNCTRMLFQDIDTYGAGDMVWVENLGGGANRYNRIRVARRPEPQALYAPRLLAANDDPFHSMSCAAGPTLENSELAYVADDYVNIHNRLLPLGRLDAGAGEAWVLDPGLVPGHGYDGPTLTPGAGPNPAISHTMDFLAPGDALKLYAAAAPHGFLGSVVLTAAPARGSNASAHLPPLPALLEDRVEPDAVVLYRVRFDPAAASLPADPAIGAFGALVQVDRFANAGAVVRNNSFHDSYNNVGRFAASDLLYEGNTVDRNANGMHISYDIAGFNFLEGSLDMRNLTFRGNSFRRVTRCQVRGAACNRTCANVSCIFSNVDAALVPQVHLSGNVAIA